MNNELVSPFQVEGRRGLVAGPEDCHPCTLSPSPDPGVLLADKGLHYR